MKYTNVKEDLHNVENSKSAIVLAKNIIEEQHKTIIQLQEEIQKLKDEINRLKGEDGKPDIKPNIRDKKKNISTNGYEKKKKDWKKSPKKLSIPVDVTHTSYVEQKALPSDAVFKGYDTLIQQDIVFERRNTLFKLEVYYSPSGKKTYRAPIPEEYTGYFGNGLKSFALAMHNVCYVTSNKLLQLLRNIEISISDGSLSRILLGNKDELLTEKNAILKAALTISYAQIDGTTARVCGKNYCTQVICNDWFTYFTTLPTKSTLDILAALQGLNKKEDLGMF